jgi:hypothetical protein
MYKYYVVECSRVNDDEFMTGVVDLESAETVAMSMWNYMDPYDRKNKYIEVRKYVSEALDDYDVVKWVVEGPESIGVLDECDTIGEAKESIRGMEEDDEDDGYFFTYYLHLKDGDDK